MATSTAAAENYDSFRAEVRQFVETNLPTDIKATVNARANISRDQAMRWHKELYKNGWGAPGWPVQFGGTGWPLTKQAILLEELALAGAPSTDNLGLSTIGPTIIRHGTPEQHARFLPGIVSYENYWAQAYSEPGSGSDLASLKCAARRDGDHYVVNGTKIWQSHAHWADRALVLVRVDTPLAPGEKRRKADGITVLLIDLKAPGVTVRPIRFMHGQLFHSQIFFDDVRVPVENRLGEEGKGWAVAKSLLVVERLFGGRVAECRNQLENLKELARTHGPEGSDLQRQPWFARRVAELEIRLQSYHAAWWSAVAGVEAGENLDVEVSKLRLIGTILLQDIFGCELEAAGSSGLLAVPPTLSGEPDNNTPPLTPDHAENLHVLHFRHRGITLGSGSAEVQRDIIARDVFNRASPGDRQHLADEGQQLLSETITRFLERDYDFEHRRDIITKSQSFDPKVWQGLADIGMLSLLVPTEADGYGGNVSDLTLVAEAMGGALVVEPYLWTAVAAAKLNTPEAERAGLSTARMMTGEQRIAVAYLEADARFDPDRCATKATAAGDGWRIDGSKVLVWGADGADRLIVSARIGSEFALFCVDPASAQIARTSYQTYNSRAAADLTFNGVAVPGTALLARGEAARTLLREMLDIVTLGTVAEAVGAMDRGLSITIDYMKTREQFGHPIAEFQALRHRVVEHCLVLYTLRSLVRLGADALNAGSSADASQAVAAAKWMSGRAARQIGHDILQLHGAIGFQDETAISHYAKHLVASDAMLGDGEYQLSRWLA
jgi:acyl-CoA dehydrogenase